MSNYFFLVNVGDDINSYVRISKFIPNLRGKSVSKIDFKIAVYTQTVESLFWNKLDELYFMNNSNVEIRSSDYKLSVGQIAVVIPCETSLKLPKKVLALPKPISRKIDTAPVSERAAIGFERFGAFSSYQGDYPYQMSTVKGTFLSFDSLFFQPDENVINKLVLVNIFSKKLTEKPKLYLNIADSISKNKINHEVFYNNSAAILEFTYSRDLSNVFYSKDCVGIPIYISYQKKKSSNLSIEHAHPPSEFFYGDNKFLGQQALKNKWLHLLK